MAEGNTSAFLLTFIKRVLIMKLTDIKWLVILCDDNTDYDTEFTLCELTNLKADCYRCLITDIDGVEFEADVNQHDAALIINGGE